MKYLIKREIFNQFNSLYETQEYISDETRKNNEKIDKSFVLNYKPNFYKFYKVPSIETIITEKNIKLFGVRYTTIEGRILRFTSKQKNFKTLYGIHIFEKNKLNPTTNILECNAMTKDVIDEIIKKIFVDKEKINESGGFWKSAGEFIKNTASLTQAVTGLITAGFMITALYSWINKKHQEKQVYNDENIAKEVEEFSTNSADENDWKVFATLTNMIDTMVLGNRNSLTINGKPGLGKTYMLKKRLIYHGMREGEDYIVIKGSVDKASFYTTLYKYRERLLIFDDCDSILGDTDFTNLLKAITDTTPRRLVSLRLKDGFGSTGGGNVKMDVQVPETFEFFGKVIIITNLPGSQIDSAVVSRTGLYTIKVDPDTMLKRIEGMVKTVRPDVPVKYKQEAFEYMRELYGQNPNLDFDLRMFMYAIDDRSSGLPNWKELVKSRIIYSDDL